MWIGILLTLIALIGVSSRTITGHASQMMLSTSFLLWGFRSSTFLTYFHNIGPVLSMLGSLIVNDLLQFLLIIFIIFYSFGVFFFNLLFPAVSTSSDDDRSFLNVAAQIFTVPLYMMFGIFEKFDFQQANSSDAGSSNIQVGELAHPTGHWWFYNILIFVFLILVNIVMVNLLIALFSLRVSRMAEKGKVIWRRKYYKMQEEYRHISPLPPPISFIYYLIKWWYTCSRSSIGFQKNGKLEHWWYAHGPVANIPKEYLKFLKFQALRLRVTRPKLLQAVLQHWGDLSELLGQTQNLVEMQDESQGASERQAEQLQLKLTAAETQLADLQQGLQKLEHTQAEQLQLQLTATEIQLADLQQGLQKLEHKQAEQLQLKLTATETQLADQLQQGLQKLEHKQAEQLQSINQMLLTLLNTPDASRQQRKRSWSMDK